MKRFLKALLAVSVAAALPAVGQAAEEKFPDKPIRLVVPFATGSGTDNTARYISRRMYETMGWQVVVENKPGANGFIGLQDVMRSPADGYTLVLTGGTTHGVNSALFKSLPYDPLGDFVPVVPGLFAPMVLFASPSLEVSTAKELIDKIKASPGKISVATGSSFQLLTSELLREQAELDVIHVAYKGSAQSMTDLIGGHVDYTFVDLAAGMPQIRSGVLKPLAVTSAKRLDMLPDVPTMAEAGLPDIQINGWAAFFAKQGTPPERLEILREGFHKYFSSPDYQKFITDNAAYYHEMSAAEMTDFIKNEIQRATETFRRAGIEPQ